MGPIVVKCSASPIAGGIRQCKRAVAFELVFLFHTLGITVRHYFAHQIEKLIGG
jgi:hypothetical protein